MWFLTLSSLLVAAHRADAHVNQRNPVEKVTKLLQKLQKEIEAEGTAEALSYDKYACFCKEQADQKQYSIEKFKSKEELLAAKIEDLEAKKTALADEIQTLNEDIGKAQGEMETAAELRADTNAEYKEKEEMLSKAISALERAIEALEASKKEMVNARTDTPVALAKYKRVIKNSMALAESLHLIEPRESSAILKMLQQPPSYSYKSNEVIATLQGLLKTFKTKKVQADQAEMTDRQSHEMTEGARRNTIKDMEKSVSEKSTLIASMEEDLNSFNTELQETEKAHEADQSFLNDLTDKCEEKASTWDQRSKTRTEELTTISKCIEMLKNDVADLYGSSTGLGLVAKRAPAVTKSSPAPAPKAGGHWVWVPDTTSKSSESDKVVSFLQLRPATEVARRKVMALLNKKADALKSTVLSTLLFKLRDTPSPFAKVKQMIEDLITRLESEADAEASQKSWCDEEMANTVSMRDEAQNKIEELNALKMEKSSLSDSLAEEISVLSAEISDLEKALAEETEIRAKDSAANNMTMEDAGAGKIAVEQALEFLENFYGSKSEFLQRETPVEGYEKFVAEGSGADGKTVDDLAPEAGFEGEYGGKGDAAKSIIGLLQVIVDDFSRSLEQTAADEEAAQADYEQFKSDTEAAIADKNDLKGTKEADKTDAELAITQAEADLKSEKEVLQNALDELEKLKPVCVDSGMSWEERKARREQEIEALKEALRILEETDFR
jgi:chromosome segregation ATPase